MKLEALAIIFLIIILPISVVLSDYVDNRVRISKVSLEYDTKLLTSCRDAIKAFQINNINNAYSDVATSKVDDIEAAANSFFYSLASNFGYTGYRAEVMKEYVPAVAFTLYDGYYIYSPYKNTLTSIDTNKDRLISRSEAVAGEIGQVYDNNYADGEMRYGLKPYVYYSCRYKYSDGGQNDFIITYTLDNYITVQGIVKNNYVYKYGYLIDLDEITAQRSSLDNNEGEIKEYVGEKKYSYVKINGVKYYLEDDPGTFDPDNCKIFYIDKDGEKNYSQSEINNKEKVEKLYKAIKENKSAKVYYEKAEEFTNWVNTNLGNLRTTDAQIEGESGEKIKNRFSGKKIFENTGNIYLNSSSNFNEHRKDIIKYTIETNLATAIASYTPLSGNNSEFIMPKIKDDDWDLIENNVCIIGFLQGLKIGDKRYNNYGVIPNTLTKEYISENDIYILSEDDHTYYAVNDTNVNLSNAVGYSKIDFESRKFKDETSSNYVTYFPHADAHGSYTSIVGSSGLADDSNDMYSYIKNSSNNVLKKIFYTALARERWGAFHVNNDQDLDYFLNDY